MGFQRKSIGLTKVAVQVARRWSAMLREPRVPRAEAPVWVPVAASTLDIAAARGGSRYRQPRWSKDTTREDAGSFVAMRNSVRRLPSSVSNIEQTIGEAKLSVRSAPTRIDEFRQG